MEPTLQQLLATEPGRVCRKCGYIRDAENVPCKACAKVLAQKYYERNKELVKSRARQWRAENMEKSENIRKSYYAKNKEKVKAQATAHQLRNNFGITVETFTEMMKYYGGVCALCKQPQDNRALSVDHDHQTGRVRGLLCIRCNGALGRIEAIQAAGQDVRAYFERILAFLNDPRDWRDTAKEANTNG